MKRNYLKWAVTVVCVLAAGVCYSCGGMSGGGDASGDEIILSDGVQAPAEEGAANAPDAAKSAAVGTADAPGGARGVEEGAANAPDAARGAEQTAEAFCYVHVCGEVRSPGVYELKAGSRIFEAVELAGGFTDEAASSYLNLAQEVADGMKIAVPSEEELEEAGGAGSGNLSGVSYAETPASDPSGGTGKVNINTADKTLLMTLKGIGEARAEDIIAYRDSNGPFHTIEDIMKVPGIKNSAFEKMKDDITV